MITTRRKFVAVLASAPLLLVVPRPLVVIRPTTDCDLSVSTLLHAMGVVGEGPYTLRVAPEGYGYARAVLGRAFVSPGRYADFTIKVERLDEYCDSWALDNGKRQFYTIGA